MNTLLSFMVVFLFGEWLSSKPFWWNLRFWLLEMLVKCQVPISMAKKIAFSKQTCILVCLHSTEVKWYECSCGLLSAMKDLLQKNVVNVLYAAIQCVNYEFM